MGVQFWLDLALGVTLAAMLLLSRKYPPAVWVRALARAEFRLIEMERASAQRAAIESDIAAAKERS